MTMLNDAAESGAAMPRAEVTAMLQQMSKIMLAGAQREVDLAREVAKLRHECAALRAALADQKGD